MKELYEYREKLIARLGEATEEFCEQCRKFNDPSATVDEGWTVHKVAFHVRDIEREVYGMRIRRTMNDDNPEFKNFDPDTWMAEHYNSNEPLEKILNEFSASMSEICEALSAMPQEGWSRLSRHSSLGKELTLQLWAERGLAHLEEHLLELKNAKNQ